MAARDRILQRFMRTMEKHNNSNVRRVYYLSLEYLMGRLLSNNLHNAGLYSTAREALADLDLDIEQVVGEQFARDLVARIRERGLRPDQPDLAHEEIARMASIRGEPTTGETALVNLARRLLTCRNPLTSPRGRPTYYEISRAELEKRFG